MHRESAIDATVLTVAVKHDLGDIVVAQAGKPLVPLAFRLGVRNRPEGEGDEIHAGKTPVER